MMIKKVTTTDDLINALPEKRQEKIHKMVDANVEKWGGARENSGRKPQNGVVLKFTKRLSEKEVKFINYAREHHINYDDLMQG